MNFQKQLLHELKVLAIIIDHRRRSNDVLLITQHFNGIGVWGKSGRASHEPAPVVRLCHHRFRGKPTVAVD